MPNLNISTYEYLALFISIAMLIFTIVTNDKSMRFAEKTIKVSGRMLVGVISLIIGGLFSVFLSKNPMDIFIQNGLVRYFLLYVFAGAAISLFSASQPVFWKSLLIATSFSVLSLVIIAYFFEQNLDIELFINKYIIGGLLSGVLISVMLSIFKLRAVPTISSMKNPFFN